MAIDARQAGIEIKIKTHYLGTSKNGKIVHTSHGDIDRAGEALKPAFMPIKLLINMASLKNYRIVPFKGLYLYAGKDAYKPRVHIYPVPDLHHPFLGAHFTLTVDGKAKIGPTAIPVFWRENYQGYERFSSREAMEIISREAQLWLTINFGFRQLIWKEMKKYNKAFMIAGSLDMIFKIWGRPGIRVQLMDIQKNMLEMDFIYEGDNKSLNLLNAASPAFTCSLTISKFLVDKIDKLIH